MSELFSYITLVEQVSRLKRVSAQRRTYTVWAAWSTLFSCGLPLAVAVDKGAWDASSSWAWYVSVVVGVFSLWGLGHLMAIAQRLGRLERDFDATYVAIETDKQRSEQAIAQVLETGRFCQCPQCGRTHVVPDVDGQRHERLSMHVESDFSCGGTS